MSLDDTSFPQIADDTLESFMDAIEAAVGDQADVDLEGGILTIDLDAGGQYVINKHAPNRQIWMSSPKSGATHYGFVDGHWACTRSGRALGDLLAEELTAATGVSIRL